jgi:hypothetical protein
LTLANVWWLLVSWLKKASPPSSPLLPLRT